MTNTALQPLNQEAQRAHEWRNTLHTWIMITGSALLMGILAYLMFGTSGVIWAVLFTGFGLWQAGRISPKVILKLYKARPLKEHEAPQLHSLMRELTARAELPSVPQLYYVPSKLMNAFAVGKPEDSAIAVTDGLIRSLSLRQIAGVLAHELSHVRNGDLRVMALGDVLTRMTGTLSTFGLLIGVPTAFLTQGGLVPWIVLAAFMAAPGVGSLLQLALSRAREYDADLDAAGLTGDPEGLASALQTLEEKQGGIWEKLVMPGARSPQPSIMRSHPKTDERVARLMSLRPQANPVIVHADEPHRPGRSIVPPMRNPRINFGRMGLWY
jgi:heat shock protein HtpX